MNDSLADEPDEVLQSIGNYELLEKLGQGGMGIVYRARHTKLGRIVALKIIRAGRFFSDTDVLRFMQEARAAGSLDHPAIVPVHEVGLEDEVYFLTMPYVAGATLEKLLKERPLTVARACQLMRTVAEAVQYAHDKGIIHRDLKPANIIVESNDRPRVVDFGLAKKLGDIDSLTATGQIVGTPSYMSPEQASGIESTTERSDVYSLGAILYACLAGSPPFQTDNPMQTLRLVISQEPVSLRVFNRAIPKDVDTICRKCLEKDPTRRYSSALALAEELERFLAGTSIKARPVGPIVRAVRWSKKHPTVSALSLGIMMVALACLGIVLLLNRVHQDSLMRIDIANRVEQVATAGYSELPRLISSLREFPVALLQSQFERQRDDGTTTDSDSRMRLNWAQALVLDQPQILDVRQIFDLPLRDAIFLRRTLNAIDDAHLRDEFIAKLSRQEPDLSTRQRIRSLGFICSSDVGSRDFDQWNSISGEIGTMDRLCSEIIDEIYANPAEFTPACEWVATFPEAVYTGFENILLQADLERARLRIVISLMAELKADSPSSIAELAMHCDADLAPLMVRYVLPLGKEIRPVLGEALRKPLPEIELDSGITLGTPEAVAKATERLHVRQTAAQRQALAAAWLCRLGAHRDVWPMLVYQPDPTIRAEILHYLREIPLDWKLLASELTSVVEAGQHAQADSGLVCGLLTLIGDAAGVIDKSNTSFPPLEKQVSQLCAEHPDAAVHAAARWTMQQLGLATAVQKLESSVQFHTLDRARDWYVTGQSQPMVILRRPNSFSMGTDWRDPNRLASRSVDSVTGDVRFIDEEPLMQRRIDRDFAIGMTEVSLRQWLAFDPEHHSVVNQVLSPTLEHPTNRISWFAAAAYCNWLSEQEGIDPSQWCFLPNESGRYALGMKLADDYLHRTGYRMPTEAEWEFACRAGTQTRRYFGDCDNLLGEYVWYIDNSEEKVLNVPGALKPNAFGLFDSLGNSLEWCIDAYAGRPHDQVHIVDDWERHTTLDNEAWRILRGSHLYCESRLLRATDLWTFRPISAEGHYGLRLARTVTTD